MAYGKNYFASTTGIPEKTKYTKQIQDVDDTVSIDGHICCSWGSGNNFPHEASKIISRTGVLNTGLKFIHKVVLGQGIFPCRVSGYE